MMPFTHGYFPTSSTIRLHKQLRPISAGGVVRLLVSGPDGSGKAFLVQRVAEQVNSDILIVRGTADPTGAPFQPIGEALRSFFEASEKKSSLKRLARGVIGDALALVPVFGSYIARLQELAEGWGESNRSIPTGSFEPAEGVIKILNKLSGSRPVLFLLEDVQSYDNDSIALLSSIIRSDKAEFSLVLTADPGFRSRKDYNFEDFRFDLTSQQRRFRVCSIENFTENETAEFVKDYRSDAVFSGSELKIIHAITNGNPGLIVAGLSEWLPEDVSLGNRPEIALLFPTDEYRVPLAISDYAERRLRGLDKGTKEILTHASVIGPIISSGLLSKILPKSEEQVGDELKEVQREYGLISAVGSGKYQFSSSLSYIAVYATIDPRSAQLKNERVANALLEMPQAEPYLLYKYLLRAERTSEALEALVSAIDSSIDNCLNPNTADSEVSWVVSLLLELETVARVKSVASDFIEKFDEMTYRAALELAEAQNFTAAISLFRYLHQHAHRVEIRARSLLKIGTYQWVAGDDAAVDPLTRVLEEHPNELSADGLLEARLTLASVLYHRGDWEAAKDRYRECFFLPHLKGDSILLASTRRNINMFYISDLALPLLKSSLLELSAVEKPDVYWEIYHNIGCVHLISGELEEARIIFSAVSQAWKASGNYKVALAENNLGILDLLTKNYTLAQRRFEQIVMDPIGDYEEISGKCHLAIIDVLTGNPEGLTKLRQLAASEDRDQELPLRDVLLYNLGWALYEAGEYQEAQLTLRNVLAVRPNPWTKLQAARIERLLRKVESRGPNALENSAEQRLGATGRRDKWAYLNLDFAFSELWCWE